MATNQQITVNQSILSCDGRFKLVLGDGSLVIYSTTGKALWSTGTAGH
jgi:hypothetical protein